jgi:hypothetical protein
MRLLWSRNCLPVYLCFARFPIRPRSEQCCTFSIGYPELPASSANRLRTTRFPFSLVCEVQCAWGSSVRSSTERSGSSRAFTIMELSTICLRMRRAPPDTATLPAKEPRRTYLARLIAADTGTPAPDAERRVEYFGVHGRCGCLAPAPSPRGQQPSVLVAIAMDGSPSPISWIGVLSLARGGRSNQFRTNDANLGHKPGDHELSIAPVIARKLGEHPEKHQLNDQWRSK